MSLPAAFRREAPDGRFVLLQVREPALTLFPESTWGKVAERLLELQRRQPEARDFVVWVASNAVEVVPDKQGRILIPAWLQDAARLNGRVLLVGALDRIELWEPSAFETVREGARRSAQFSAQVFS